MHCSVGEDWRIHNGQPMPPLSQDGIEQGDVRITQGKMHRSVGKGKRTQARHKQRQCTKGDGRQEPSNKGAREL
jgi:hypothetical protein